MGLMCGRNRRGCVRTVRAAAVVGWLLGGLAAAGAAERAVTVLADFESATVAATVGEVRNVLAGDCAVRRVSIPARGQGALALDVGATQPDASLVCDLLFREPGRFSDADEIAAFVWLAEGEFELAFRLIDRRDQVFETPPLRVSAGRRWTRVAAALEPPRLLAVGGEGPCVPPIELIGVRVATRAIGKQTIFLDDIQIAHRVEVRDLVAGSFEFNEPTRIYEPGATVGAVVVLENRSRRMPLNIRGELAWTRPDGTVLATQQAGVSLPAGGDDFRSYRKLDFSQRIREPGLYRLVATVRATGWTTAATFETTIAVTPSNRRLARGRAEFFGVRSNLLREPDVDQLLEVGVARDIGVNLLLLDVPWARLEAKRGTLDCALLDPLVDALLQRDIAPAVLLTTPPTWLPPSGPDRLEALATLLSRLSDHFGGRLTRIHLSDALLPDGTTVERLAATSGLRTRLAKSHPRLDLWPPAVDVSECPDAAEVGRFVAAQAGLPVLFATSGPVAEAATRLDEYRRAAGLTWQPTHAWLHQSEAVVGGGSYADAEDVLRFYLWAATAGVGGLIWSDLRDDENDPNHGHLFRGLVRRDFSPKAALLGYAAAAGQLTGFRCVGPVPGAGAEFASGLFIGSDRQVAVLLPQPGAVLPAVLAPALGVPGELTAQDFERRQRPIASGPGGPLVLTLPRPMFLTLRMNVAESRPQITLARPWLRAPGLVLCGESTTFAVELDAPTALRRSFLHVVLPKNSPLESTLTATAIQAEAGETVRQEITLRRASGREFEQVELVLKVGIGETVLEVPVVVRPLARVARGPGNPTPSDRIGELVPPEGQRVTAKGTVAARYDETGLRLSVRIEDERLVPLRASPSGGATGDQLLIGLAGSQSGTAVEVRFDPSVGGPAAEPLHGTPSAILDGWSCLAENEAPGVRTFRVRIPAAAFGASRLAGGQRVLVAVHYIDDDADGFPAARLRWGRGLDGSRGSGEYRVLELLND